MRGLLITGAALLFGFMLAGCRCPFCEPSNEQGHFGHTTINIDMARGAIWTEPFRWLPDNNHRRAWCKFKEE